MASPRRAGARRTLPFRPLSTPVPRLLPHTPEADAPAASISVVLPTHNRRAALERNFSSALALEGPAELVVVVDGSTDGTREYLDAVGDHRVRVIEHERRRGSQAARNTGVRAASGAWVLFLEDDCWVPPDYARVLLEEALAHHADIVGAPWINLRNGETTQAAFRRASANRARQLRLGAHPSTFPESAIETPFLPALALMRREIPLRLPYDEGFRRNAWREETSLFVAAARAGHRCVLTPRTASFQLGQWAGGQRMSTVPYEWWIWRNNWRFLRMHGRWLQEHGHIRWDPSLEQVKLMAQRSESLLRHRLRQRRGHL
jgi:glycosyltransferase involved in cell wall biosynthesis